MVDHDVDLSALVKGQEPQPDEMSRHAKKSSEKSINDARSRHLRLKNTIFLRRIFHCCKYLCFQGTCLTDVHFPSGSVQTPRDSECR